jgi:hypothetical protein
VSSRPPQYFSVNSLLQPVNNQSDTNGAAAHPMTFDQLKQNPVLHGVVFRAPVDVVVALPTVGGVSYRRGGFLSRGGRWI